MKKIFALGILTLFIWSASPALHAHAVEPEPEDESTKLNLWIPGVLIKWVADIADDEMEGSEAMAVDFMRHIGSVTICIREGEQYAAQMDNKMQRKLNRMERQDYEQLLSVNTEGERVEMSVRTNKHNTIKRAVLLVHEDASSFVYIKMHCRIKADEVGQLIQAMDQF